MIHKTRGIVLHKFKYSDSSIIAKIYTEKFGIQAYLLHGVHGKKSNNKIALFQPAALLELDVYHKEKRDLQKIKEAKVAPPFNSIPFDFIRSAVVLFIAEVLYKSLREEEQNEQLFDFLWTTIKGYDESEVPLPNFHLFFLVKLTRYLGFEPQGECNNNYFDLNEGSFMPTQLPGNKVMELDLSQALWQILGTNFVSIADLNFNRKERKELLKNMLDYYYLHLNGMGEVKSHHVLEMVMD